MNLKQITKVVANCAALLLLASGCSQTSKFQTVDVLTTTNVWADITKSIAGTNFSVEPILTNTNQDPHSYEATVLDQLKVSKAKLIIAACNESDAFIKQLVKTETNLLCLASDFDPKANPHIWYQPDSVLAASQKILASLRKLKPAAEVQLVSNFENFNQARNSFNASLANPGSEIASKLTNKSFTAVEPVANYLLTQMGLQDLTPESVKQAGLNETDLSPSEIAELKVATEKAGMFAYNSSQPSLQSSLIQKWLKADPKRPLAVGFSEQLPKGVHYIDWMKQNRNAVWGALTKMTID